MTTDPAGSPTGDAGATLGDTDTGAPFGGDTDTGAPFGGDTDTGAPFGGDTGTGVSTLHFPCTSCGSRVEYAPGTTQLKCPYCGSLQQIADTGTQIEEHSYDAWASAPKPTARVGAHVYTCSGCGAKTESDNLSERCQFCGSPLVADAGAVELIAPEAVVPFKIDKNVARERFRSWVTSRWFAPTALKKVGSTEGMDGTYLPHWTYDSDTTTDYTGQRGEHYWVTETYTEMVDGQPQTRTREVMRTRWYPAAGTVERAFDDVLVPGTTQLPQNRLDKLGPWELESAAPYQPAYLSGYRTLRYDIEPDSGLETAKVKMSEVIRDDCRADIGGDEQQVHSMDTRYAEIMFKLVLLPVWIAAYLYAGKTWQVVINANTGEVIGDRPYSKWKIALTTLAILIVAGVGLYLYARRGQ
jgi:DNA-directed RNA polymerase subunit RPC12/RpoP